MMRWGLLTLVLILALPAGAVVLRSDGTVTVPAGRPINDDLVVTGGTVMIQGEVAGDLVVAAGTVDVSAPVRGSVMIAGGTITLRQPVGGSVYIAGGNVQISSTVARNVVVAGGTLQGNSGMTVGRDLAVSGGDVTMSGKVSRDFKGNIGTLRITDGARIGRNLNVITNNPQIASGAVIVGERNIRLQPHERENRGAGIIGWILWQLFMGAALYLVGAIFLALAPKLTEQTQAVLRTHPWASLLTGLIIFAVVPIIFIILLVTIIGIPLAFILLWLYLSATFISPIFPAIYLGRVILRNPAANRYLAMLIGIAILVVIRLIPFLGALVTLIALFLGLGALLLAWQGRSTHPLYPAVRTEA